MKAKIKANGEIVNIIKEDVDFVCADNGYIYKFDDIEILNHSNVENNAWSEEDTVIVNNILTCIEHCKIEDIEAQYNGNRIVNPKRYEPMSNWLKSLKDRVQPQWKPSEEELNALDEVYKTHGANSACRRIIFNLLNDLKKLSHE